MKGILWVVNILLAVSLIAWPLGLFLLAFMFEGPGATENIILIFIGLTILAYPIPVLYSVTFFLKNRKIRNVKELATKTIVGLSPIITISVLNIFLNIMCHGSFGCR